MSTDRLRACYRGRHYTPQRRQFSVEHLRLPLVRTLEDTAGSMAPLVCPDRIFTNRQGDYACLDATTLEPRWLKSKHHDHPRFGYSDSLYDGRHVLVQYVPPSATNEPLWLEQLDAADGSVLHEYHLGQVAMTEQAIVTSSRNCVVSARTDEHYTLTCLDLDSGSKSWSREYDFLPSVTFAADMCLLEDEAHFLVDDCEAAVSCRRVRTGELAWRFDFSVEQLAVNGLTRDETDLESVKRIISVEDRVYLGLCDHVVALDAASGEEIWRQVTEIGSTADSMIYDPQLDRLCCIFASWYLALDAQTGEVLVDRKHPDQVPEVMLPGFASVTKDHFLAASWRRPELYAFDKQSGELVWKTELDDRVARPNAPVVVGGRVYVVDLSHNLYVFDPARDD